MVNRARELKHEDIDKVRELHEKFYPNLEFPDFMTNFYCAFAITNSNNDIVIAGGIQPTAEIILVTDKDKSAIQIGRALIEVKNASLYVGKRFGLDELVAFIKDNDSFTQHLIQHGFYPRSSALAMKVPKWEKINEIHSCKV